MKRYLLILCMVVLAGIALAQTRVVVDGPHNNSQTTSEYVTTSVTAGVSSYDLYYLNAKDMPFMSVTGGSANFISRLVTSNVLESRQFMNGASPRTFTGSTFPAIIVGGTANPDYLTATQIGTPNFIYNSTVHSANNWPTLEPGLTGVTGFTRFAKSISQAYSGNGNTVTREWVGTKVQSGNSAKIVSTADDWQNASLVTNTMQTSANDHAIYSLAIDDRTSLRQALCSVTNDVTFLNANGATEALKINCDHVYCINSTTDGAGWQELNIIPTSSYNVLCAMSFIEPSHNGSSQTQQNSDYYNFMVVGWYVNNNGTAYIFSRTASTHPADGTTISWYPNDSLGTHIDAGTINHPSLPTDLVVQKIDFNQNGQYRAVLTTTNGVYFATLVNSFGGFRISGTWVKQTGSTSHPIKSNCFTKIASRPWARVLGTGDVNGRHFAVAGESTCYITDNADATTPDWYEITNVDQYLYPRGGASQNANLIYGIGSRNPFGSNTDSIPIFAQVAPHQQGTTSPGGYYQTAQVGYTNSDNQNNIILVTPPSSANALAAFCDLGLNNTAHTGVVYYCPEGTNSNTWIASTWPTTTNFGTNSANYPIPSDICGFDESSDATNGKVFIAFKNTNTGTGVPVTAYSNDGGENWSITTTHTGAPTNDDPKYIAASYTAGTPVTTTLYLADKDKLYSSVDLGASWSNIFTDTGFLISGVKTQPANASYIAMGVNPNDDNYTPTIHFSTDGGNSFFHAQFPPSITGTELKNLESFVIDPTHYQTYWAAFKLDMNGHSEQKLIMWHGGPNPEYTTIVDGWVNDNYPTENGPDTSHLSMDISGGTTGNIDHRRIIWSANEWDYGSHLPSNNIRKPVRYYEFDIANPGFDGVSSAELQDPGQPVLLVNTLIVPANDTLRLGAGLQLQIADSCTLRVQGTLIVGDNSGSQATLTFLGDSTQAKWPGIIVENGGHLIVHNTRIANSFVGITNLTGATSVSVDNSVLNSNSIALSLSNTTSGISVTSCTFINNTQSIIVNSGITASATIRDCNFTQSDNCAYWNKGSKIHFAHNAISYTASDDNQKAVYLYTCDTTYVDSCTMTANSKGSGIYLEHCKLHTYVGNSKIAQFGEGVVSTYSNARFLADTVCLNNSHGFDWSQNYPDTSVHWGRIDHCVIDSNGLGTSGSAGFYGYACSPIFTCNLFFDNFDFAVKTAGTPAPNFYDYENMNNGANELHGISGQPIVYVDNDAPTFVGKNGFYLASSAGIYCKDTQSKINHYINGNYFNYTPSKTNFIGNWTWSPTGTLASCGEELEMMEEGAMGDLMTGNAYMAANQPTQAASSYDAAVAASTDSSEAGLAALGKMVKMTNTLPSVGPLLHKELLYVGSYRADYALNFTTADAKRDSILAIGDGTDTLRVDFDQTLSDLLRPSVMSAGPQAELAHQLLLASIHRAGNKLSGVQPLATPHTRAVPLPEKFVLHPVYPNPFNATTNIRFDVPNAGRMQVMVFDVMGRLVVKLADKDFGAGHYQLQWDGKNSNGITVSSGAYFVTVKSPTFVATKKAVLLK